MFPSNQISLFYPSQEVFNIPINKNTIINNLSKSLLNEKLIKNNDNIKNNIYNSCKSRENKYSENYINLNCGKDSIILEKNKIKINQLQKEKNIKKIIKLKESQEKIIEKYKIQIQQLFNSLNIKEQKINSLKNALQKAKLNNFKKWFENLEINTINIKIISKKILNNEKKSIIKENEFKIQNLDKMLILNKIKKRHLKIESRDSIEIFQTQRPILQAQIITQMKVEPFEKKQYFQIMDQFKINGLCKNENDLQIDSRDSLEIFPTKKSPLKAQRIKQMLIERMISPKFLIQKIDNMFIMKEINKYKIKNIIEERDSIQICSPEKQALQAQHIENMFIDSIEYDKNLFEIKNNSCLNEFNNKKLGNLTISLEHIPMKKSPLHLKNPEEIKTKYLKKNISENRNKFYYEKDDIQTDYIESVNNCDINFKLKSNYSIYNSSNCFNNGNFSLKPSSKANYLKDFSKIKNNFNNHNLAEISYKNKNNLITPRPSVQQVKKTSKIFNIEKVEKIKEKNSYFLKFKNKYTNNGVIFKNHNNKEDNYKILNVIYTNRNNKYNSINNFIIEKKHLECENMKGRNVRIIKTQKHGPSIIEKIFMAHSCKKCSNNYLTFQKKVINKNNYN